ncbi:MAG: CHAD domain-containing protein [Armatimonadota bacterium]
MLELKPDDSYTLLGAEALLGHLAALGQEIDGVRAAEDIEYVHRMRVASRRVRSTLAQFVGSLPRKRFPEWERQTRRITRALGAARDTDVQIEFVEKFLAAQTSARLETGVKRLLLRLTQRREELQVRVLKALDRFTASRVIEDMEQTLRQTLVRLRLQKVETSSPYVFQQALLGIARRMEELLAYEPCIVHPERVRELHEMRIAAKRLRYTMEVFAPLYGTDLKKPLQTVRKVQEMLGDIHDSDVWVDYLPHFLETEKRHVVSYYGHGRAFTRLLPGIQALQDERRQFRMNLHKEFVAYWQEINKQQVWEQLLQTLQSRLIVPEPEPAEEVASP